MARPEFPPTRDTHALVLDAFRTRFVREPEFVVRAPGRVNLIGEHTDYTGGLVLPFAIDRALHLAVAPRGDDRVYAFACDLAAEGEEVEFAVGDAATTGFGAYLSGAIAASLEQGEHPGGMDLVIASDIPVGSGLSSSAALCVAVAIAIDRLLGADFSALRCARRAHRAESHFVGTGCGILDPFAIALCGAGHALRIDCEDESTRSVPLPVAELSFVISHSGVSRELAGPAAGQGYRDRVAQCARGLEGIVASEPDAAPRSLRALSPDGLVRFAGQLDEVDFRRVRHVVGENARVDRVCRLLEAEPPIGLAAVGAEIRASHASLRDDYEVSIPQLDMLCEIADAQDGVYGSRLLGAGFGGCALHLVKPEAVDAVCDVLGARYRDRFGKDTEVFGVKAAAGAGIEAVE
ncbi:MAG: galactokinase [Myxococcota bacterium]|jgi:galactokinase|nr:galactokinase [Myxococcota bacterium]